MSETITQEQLKEELCYDPGEFKNKEDAISARKKANIEYRFHTNHGINPCQKPSSGK